MALWTAPGVILAPDTNVSLGVRWSINGSSQYPYEQVTIDDYLIEATKWSIAGSTPSPVQYVKEVVDTSFYWKNG